MYLDVDLTVDPAEVRLRAPQDCRSLKVVVRDSGGGLPALYEALEGIGHLDSSGNALLRTSALLAMAGRRARDPAWLRSFERMVEYAGTRGWVALDGDALQAHCEWRQS
jgi:hypothetical protein